MLKLKEHLNYKIVKKRNRIPSYSLSSSELFDASKCKSKKLVDKINFLPFRGDFEKDGYDFIRWQAMTAGYLDKVNASKEEKLLALYRAIRGDARTLLSKKNFEEISDIFAALENVYIQVGR